MVWKPGSKHSVSSSRVTARRNDWNSISDLHQGPRPTAASRGRIHDRSPIRCQSTKKPLPRGGRPYMTNEPKQKRRPELGGVSFQNVQRMLGTTLHQIRKNLKTGSRD